MDTFPILTDRLILRRFQSKDCPAFVAYRSDAEVAQYQSWTTISTEEAQVFIQAQEHARFGTPGEWFQVAIASRGTDDLIGDMGIHVTEDAARAEIGFTLSRANQGQGFAFEAVTAMVNVIFDIPGIERIEATADARNVASIGLLRKLGMKHESTQEAWFKGGMCTEYLFVLLKTGWLLA
jgi:RimJ/RimL family protein N-acetyltransferase